MLEVDHVIAVVEDLAAAAHGLRNRYGLGSVEGGRHPGHGTENRIVPLGSSYLELMAVHDHNEALASPMGRWAFEATNGNAVRPISLCLRTDDITAVAAALGEAPLSMSRQRPDGSVLAWRLAGADGMFGPNRLPFFIQWEGQPSDHPGAVQTLHEGEVFGISAVTIGDPGDRRILASDVETVTIGSGIGVTSTTIATAAGDITLD